MKAGHSHPFAKPHVQQGSFLQPVRYLHADTFHNARQIRVVITCNDNEIIIKREPLVFTRARRAVKEKKKKKERLGQYNSNNKLILGQYTSRYNLHLSLSLSLPPLPLSLPLSLSLSLSLSHTHTHTHTRARARTHTHTHTIQQVK